MHGAYQHAHIFLGGFTQRVGNAGNGIFTAFDRTYRGYASQTSIVEYFPWYVSPADVAHTIALRNEDCLATYGTRMKLQIVGYSFGGQTAANVCRNLLHNTPGLPRVTIDRLCLCDAVARCGRLGWLHAANPFSTIRLHRNVTLLNAFVQRHRRWRFAWPPFSPAGHKLLLDVTTQRGVEALRIEPIELDAEHTEIDNHPKFQTAVAIGAAAIHVGDDDDDQPCGCDQTQCDLLPYPRRKSA